METDKRPRARGFGISLTGRDELTVRELLSIMNEFTAMGKPHGQTLSNLRLICSALHKKRRP